MWYDNTQGGEFDLPIGAVVKFSDTGQIQIVDDDGEVIGMDVIYFTCLLQEHWVDQSNAHKIKVMHITSEESVEDMVSLYACGLPTPTQIIAKAKPCITAQKTSTGVPVHQWKVCAGKSCHSWSKTIRMAIHVS